MNTKVIGTQIVKHLPQIFSGLAMIGVGATAICSGKDTLKANQILLEKDVERINHELETLDPSTYDPDDIMKRTKLSFRETVKLTWKCYIPTAIAMISTFTFLALSDRMSAAQVASMGAACGYLIKQKTELEKKIKEEVGEEKFQEISDQVNQNIYLDKFEEDWAEPTGKGELLCYESFTGRWFYSSESEVNDGLRRFKKYYSETDYVSYNDLYSELNIAPSYLGNELGWFCDYQDGYSPSEIDFETYHTDKLVPGKDVLVIELADTIYYPYYDWMEM